VPFIFIQKNSVYLKPVQRTVFFIFFSTFPRFYDLLSLFSVEGDQFWSQKRANLWKKCTHFFNKGDLLVDKIVAITCDKNVTKKCDKIVLLDVKPEYVVCQDDDFHNGGNRLVQKPTILNFVFGYSLFRSVIVYGTERHKINQQNFSNQKI
jgi:hypothetical protein